MREGLTIGSEVTTRFGKTAKIVRYIAEGGQGYVYVVNYNGKEMALKWYKQAYYTQY